MKRFFTLVPFQIEKGLKTFRYTAVDNERLQMERPTSFPIMTAVNGYVEPGEEFTVVAVLPDTEIARRNLERLREELRALCEQKPCPEPKLLPVFFREALDVSAQVELFGQLICHVEDEDELFCCMTFGSKPMSQAMLMALQYAYRVKRNATIECILYGEIRRPAELDMSTWTARVYDMTALVRLDEVVHMLAARKVPSPEDVIRQLISF